MNTALVGGLSVGGSNALVTSFTIQVGPVAAGMAGWISTGSEISVFPTSELPRLYLSLEHLMGLSGSFEARTYTGEVMPFRGAFYASVEVNRKRAMVCWFVSDVIDRPILGMDAITALCLSVGGFGVL